ncbi:DUF1491 family protein [Rhizobium sp. KVB221]|uniref:DUF1491 family protein n=1 Tax=Rhizobium setariae TaxID=2801340 RepID=A0A936YIQ0_9HYPH|nr:DUF1491 family protein [Rhizobium setariae]MBL0371009.1 DUF1491 family protein [Rhizobium setariae]
MRVTSDFFVSALVRRVFSSGGFAAIERKGAMEAGAIFIRQRFRDGLETLYAPAPQAYFGEGKPSGRQFEIRIEKAEAGAIDEVLAREARFDSDLWVVELEAEAVSDLVDVAVEGGAEPDLKI